MLCLLRRSVVGSRIRQQSVNPQMGQAMSFAWLSLLITDAKDIYLYIYNYILLFCSLWLTRLSTCRWSKLCQAGGSPFCAGWDQSHWENSIVAGVRAHCRLLLLQEALSGLSFF